MAGQARGNLCLQFSIMVKAQRLLGKSGLSFMVYAEPMDGPVSQDQFQQLFSHPNLNFTTTFFGGNENPQPVTLSAGGSASANITAPSGAPRP